MSSSNNDSLLFPFQSGCFFLHFIFLPNCPGQNISLYYLSLVQCWEWKLWDQTFCLFLNVRGKTFCHSLLSVMVEFFVDVLYHIEVSFYSIFVESFYYGKVLNFAKCFFLCFLRKRGFVFYSLEMVYCTDFFYVKSTLHSWV